MPEYPAPPDDADPTASQMMAEMRKLAARQPLLLNKDGWYSAHELRHADGGNLNNTKLKERLNAARAAGRLEESMDWRMGMDYCRRVKVFRLLPPEPPADES